MDKTAKHYHGSSSNTIIWGILYGLTIISVWVTQLDFSNFAIVVALGLASIKVFLVASYFMHLRFENRILSIMVIVTLLVFLTFITLTMLDYVNR